MSKHQWQTDMNKNDLELLSCYLDQEIQENDRLLLEQRLYQEPALQVELEELRATVALLHDLEPVMPPRSFTLDPAQFQQKRLPWSRWLPFGGVAATLLMFLTFSTLLLQNFSFADSPIATEKGLAQLAPPKSAHLNQSQQPSTLQEAPAAVGGQPAPMQTAPTFSATTSSGKEIAEHAHSSAPNPANISPPSESFSRQEENALPLQPISTKSQEPRAVFQDKPASLPVISPTNSPQKPQSLIVSSFPLPSSVAIAQPETATSVSSDQQAPSTTTKTRTVILISVLIFLNAMIVSGWIYFRKRTR